MNNNQTKKKMKGSDKITMKNKKICKNDKCVDKRTINDTIKKSIYLKDFYSKTIYYSKFLFYDIKSKTIYDTNKLLLYDTLKNKKGFFIKISFKYFISKDSDDAKIKIHTFSYESMMFFYKYTDEEIKEDPELLEESGISKKTPYAFSQKDKGIIFENKIIKTKIPKFDTVTFQDYINDIISQIKHKNIPKINTTGLYEDTYKKLLHMFYNKCTTSNTDIFKIEYFA